MAEHKPSPSPEPPGPDRPGQGLPDRPGRGPSPEHPIAVPPRKQPKEQPDGPDLQSAAPTDDGSTIQTSAGPLDRETVLAHRVGGTGWVSVQEEP
jgi:hypothetical protein